MKTSQPKKPRGCSKNSSKREVYSNTNLPQETNKKRPLKQPNLKPRTVRERTTKTQS